MTHKQLLDYLSLFKSEVKVTFHLMGDIPINHSPPMSVDRLRGSLYPRRLRDDPVSFADEFGSVYIIDDFKVGADGIRLNLKMDGSLADGIQRPEELSIISEKRAAD